MGRPQPGGSPPTPTETDWRAVCVLISAAIVAAFQIGKGAVALPDLRQQFGMSLAAASWAISIFYAVGVVGGLAIGILADRVGHRRAVLLGLVIISVASFAGCLAPNAAILLATRLAEGLGFLLTVIAGPALLVRATRAEDRKLAFGFWGSYMPSGTALMMLLSPALLLFGWRTLWFANGLAAASSAVLLALVTRSYSAGGVAGGGKSSIRTAVSSTLSHQGPVLLAITFASYTLPFLSVLGFLPTILVEGEGFGRLLAGSVAAAAIAVNVIGTTTAGWLLQRGIPRWLLMIVAAAVLSVTSLCVYSTALPFAARYAAVLLFSAVGGLVPTAIFSAAPIHTRDPKLLAATNGLIMQGSSLGQVVGPTLVAAIAQVAGGWRWSPIVIGASAACLAVCALRLRSLESSVS